MSIFLILVKNFSTIIYKSIIPMIKQNILAYYAFLLFHNWVTRSSFLHNKCSVLTFNVIHSPSHQIPICNWVLSLIQIKDKNSNTELDAKCPLWCTENQNWVRISSLLAESLLAANNTDLHLVFQTVVHILIWAIFLGTMFLLTASMV